MRAAIFTNPILFLAKLIVSFQHPRATGIPCSKRSVKQVRGASGMAAAPHRLSQRGSGRFSQQGAPCSPGTDRGDWSPWNCAGTPQTPQSTILLQSIILYKYRIKMTRHSEAALPQGVVESSDRATAALAPPESTPRGEVCSRARRTSPTCY